MSKTSLFWFHLQMTTIQNVLQMRNLTFDDKFLRTVIKLLFFYWKTEDAIEHVQIECTVL